MYNNAQVKCGHGSMAEQVLPKHLIRVRFSLSALFVLKDDPPARFFAGIHSFSLTEAFAVVYNALIIAAKEAHQHFGV